MTLRPEATRRLPGASLLLLVVAVTVFFFPVVTESLEYNRGNLDRGQTWRVLTGHFTHWSLNHLFWDALSFSILGVLCERRGRVRFLICVLASALSISLIVLLFAPGMTHYRGLSGVDSALLVLLLVDVSREKLRTREWGWVVAAAGVCGLFIAKTAYEFVMGQNVFVESAGVMTPVPVAHVVGGTVGFLIGWISESRGPASHLPKT